MEAWVRRLVFKPASTGTGPVGGLKAIRSPCPDPERTNGKPHNASLQHPIFAEIARGNSHENRNARRWFWSDGHSSSVVSTENLLAKLGGDHRATLMLVTCIPGPGQARRKMLSIKHRLAE